MPVSCHFAFFHWGRSGRAEAGGQRACLAGLPQAPHRRSQEALGQAERAAPCPVLPSLFQAAGGAQRARRPHSGPLPKRFPPVPASPRVTPSENPVPPQRLPHPSPSPATRQLPFPGLLCVRHMDHPQSQLPEGNFLPFPQCTSSTFAFPPACHALCLQRLPMPFGRIVKTYHLSEAGAPCTHPLPGRLVAEEGSAPGSLFYFTFVDLLWMCNWPITTTHLDELQQSEHTVQSPLT